MAEKVVLDAEANLMRRQIASHGEAEKRKDDNLVAMTLELQSLTSQVHTLRTAVPGEPMITVLEHERILLIRLEGTRVAHAMEATEALGLKRSASSGLSATIASHSWPMPTARFDVSSK